MPRTGQYTKSDFLIWDQNVVGARWNLRVHCSGCADGLAGLVEDPQPYVPNVEDLTWFCQGEASLVDIRKLYRVPVDSLSLLDGVDNVPTGDKEEVESWFLSSVSCPCSGDSHVPRAEWHRV